MFEPNAALVAAAFASILALLSPALAAAENPATELEAPTVKVIGTTPLPGIGTPIEQVPANVQGVTGGADSEATGAGSGRFSKQQSRERQRQRRTSQSVSAGRKFPRLHGFAFAWHAAGNFGVPGRRARERSVRRYGELGLSPESAISSVNLIPGSNPVFGLNTLGGALSINTKSGLQYPGFTAAAYGGSWGRSSSEFEWGGHGKNADFFVTAHYLDEDGWRDFSASRLKQLFAKAGFDDEQSDFDLSFTYADNKLQGTQALPLSFLDDREQPYTHPDITENEL